jgi:hypothetical protein
LNKLPIVAHWGEGKLLMMQHIEEENKIILVYTSGIYVYHYPTLNLENAFKNAVNKNEIIRELGKLLTIEVWEKLKDKEILSINPEQNAAARRAEFKRNSRIFSNEIKSKYLFMFPESKIDHSTWRKEGFEDIFREALQCNAIKYVVAVKEVGLPIEHSDSVVYDIQKIAEEILDERWEEAKSIYLLGIFPSVR